MGEAKRRRLSNMAETIVAEDPELFAFEMDFTRPIREVYVPVSSEAVPALVTSGECACCHRPAASVQWHAIPTDADLWAVRPAAQKAWADLGRRGRVTEMIGTNMLSMMADRCRRLTERDATAPTRSSDNVLQQGQPIRRCDFCLAVDDGPVPFHEWPARRCAAPHGRDEHGRLGGVPPVRGAGGCRTMG